MWRLPAVTSCSFYSTPGLLHATRQANMYYFLKEDKVCLQSRIFTSSLDFVLCFQKQTMFAQLIIFYVKINSKVYLVIPLLSSVQINMGKKWLWSKPKWEWAQPVEVIYSWGQTVWIWGWQDTAGSDKRIDVEYFCILHSELRIYFRQTRGDSKKTNQGDFGEF